MRHSEGGRGHRAHGAHGGGTAAGGQQPASGTLDLTLVSPRRSLEPEPHTWRRSLMGGSANPAGGAGGLRALSSLVIAGAERGPACGVTGAASRDAAGIFTLWEARHIHGGYSHTQSREVS